MPIYFDTAAFEKAAPPKPSPAKNAPPAKPDAPKKTLKQELAEIGDFEQIQKDADNIPQDLLDLLKAVDTAPPMKDDEGAEEDDEEEDPAPQAPAPSDAQQPDLPMKETKKQPSGSLEAAAKPTPYGIKKGLLLEEVTDTLDLFRGTEFYAEALDVLSRIQSRCADRHRLHARSEALWSATSVVAWNRFGFHSEEERDRELDEVEQKLHRLASEQAEDEAQLLELQAKVFKATADRITRDKLSKGINALKKAAEVGNERSRPRPAPPMMEEQEEGVQEEEPKEAAPAKDAAPVEDAAPAKEPVKKGAPSATPEPDPEEIKEKQAEEAEKKAEEEEEDEDE